MEPPIPPKARRNFLPIILIILLVFICLGAFITKTTIKDNPSLTPEDILEAHSYADLMDGDIFTRIALQLGRSAVTQKIGRGNYIVEYYTIYKIILYTVIANESEGSAYH